MDAPVAWSLERFNASAQRVVDYLNSRTPLTDWSVSRIAADEQLHLHVRGDLLLRVGTRVPWHETFCRRMLAGASRVVLDSKRDPDYADLPKADAVRAYAGVPIVDGDGSVFGTLCGVRAEPLRQAERVDEDLLGVFAEVLSDQLFLLRSCADLQQSALAAAELASSDRLTGLMNRRGWDRLVAEAQQRVDSLGDPAGVLMVDLDGLKAVNDGRGHQAGDALIAAAGAALRRATLADGRAGDRVARYGGDEFAVWVEGEAVVDIETVAAHYARALAEAGVAASVGAARVTADGVPGTSVGRALARADAAMYATKAARRHQREGDALAGSGPR